MTENNNSDACSLFLCAVREMESASAFKRQKLHTELKPVLQRSANCLARALLVSKGIVVSKSEMNADLFSSETDRLTDNNSAVYKTILEVLDFDTESKSDDLAVSNVKHIYNRYGDALIRARKMLSQELGHNKQQRQRVKQKLFAHTGLVKISYGLISLLILITFPIVAYHYLKPVSNFDVTGQIFWKTKGNLPFTPQQSHHFTVKVDNRFREYTVDLGEPVGIFLLRLDPVNKKYLTDIELEWIRLLSKEGVLLHESTSENFKQWSCNNCVKLPETEKDIFSIRPVNDDLYLISTRLDQEKVKSIIIRMRTASKKTFWEWVLAIDKNFERISPNQKKP